MKPHCRFCVGGFEHDKIHEPQPKPFTVDLHPNPKPFFFTPLLTYHRERERERQRDRETERQRDRGTERQRDRETERQRDRETERQRERETERQKDRETERLNRRGQSFLSVFVSRAFTGFSSGLRSSDWSAKVGFWVLGFGLTIYPTVTDWGAVTKVKVSLSSPCIIIL